MTAFPQRGLRGPTGSRAGLHTGQSRNRNLMSREGFSLQEFFICDPVLKTSESSGRPAEGARTEGRSH